MRVDLEKWKSADAHAALHPADGAGATVKDDDPDFARTLERELVTAQRDLAAAKRGAEKVWIVYDNQFGNIDSAWSKKALAEEAAVKANGWSKKLYDGRYFYIVTEWKVDSSEQAKEGAS